jgi:hypothetical protein
MPAIRTALRCLLLLPAPPAAAATAAVAWLRWEFARLDHDAASYARLFEAPVAALEPGAEAAPCREH